ncbi:ParB/RepB/Spo0J family partition protein [Nostoc sp. CHAB 5834]|nr:ParB/RepB/Spo0J family partition protein [Nostoc sp. CHAB 5834]
MTTAGFKRRKNIDPVRIRQAALNSMTPENVLKDWPIGETREIPLHLVQRNPANARAWYPRKPLKELVQSLKTQGQLTAATAYVMEDGAIILIDGHRRMTGAEEASLATLRIERRPAPESTQALYLSSREANLHQAGNTPLDDAVVWTRLLKEKVFKNQKDLAAKLNLTEPVVSRVLSLGKLPSTVMERVSECEELLTLKMLNALREYYDLHGMPATFSLIDQVVANNWGYREVEARTKEAEKPRGTRARAQAFPLTYKGAIGAVRVFDGGARIELSLKGLPVEDSSDLQKRLMKLFA